MKTGSPDAASASTFLTVSNLLSLSRALLIIPFVYVMLTEAPWSKVWGGVIMCLAAVTDNLDGRIARHYHQETEWGRILDPLADKLGVAAVGLVFLYLGLIPLWFVVVLLTRDVLIFLGGLYLKARVGVVLPSHPVGKWAVGIIFLTFLVLLYGPPGPVAMILLWPSVGMLVLSFVFYVRRFIEVLTQKGP